MKLKHPWKLIGIGFVLVLMGFVLPFLMIIDVIKTSLLLSLLSHGASVTGLLLGLLGTAMITKIHEDKKRHDTF